MVAKRREKRTCWAPSIHGDASPNGTIVKMKYFRPFFQTLSYPIYGDVDISASLLRLLPSCRPLNIANFIVAVVVYPIKGVLIGRATSDSVEQFLDTIQAKLDASTTVVGVNPMVKKPTATFCPFNRPVLRRSRALTRFTVNQKAFSCAVTSKTPARFSVPPKQNFGLGYDNGTTVTPTEPAGFVSNHASEANHCESRKFQACEVSKSRMGWKRMFGNCCKIYRSHVRLRVGEFWLGLRELFPQFRRPFSILA